MSAEPDDRAVLELLEGLLERTHLCAPSDLARVVAEQGAGFGAEATDLYVIDHEQGTLVPLPGSESAGVEPLSVAGTVAGRAFATVSVLKVAGGDQGSVRLWLPLLDGTERVGVMAVSAPEAEMSEHRVAVWRRYAHLVTLLLVSKGEYGDFLAVARRRQEMTLASELLWGLAPPLVFATDGLALAGMLEPAYDNGGDALDYALNGRVLHLAVMDAMGHGLAAAGVAAFALAAYRRSRRSGSGLLETVAAMDAAVGEEFPERRFVTAVIAELELDTGRLSWVSAGHPPPLLVRGGRKARELAASPAPPLGIDLPHAEPVVAAEALEPGDLVLFYTDGLTEARGADGALLDVDGVAQFIEREASAGLMAPETMRRLRHAVLESPRAQLRDDATALLVEWRGGSEAKLLPATGEDPVRP